MDIYKGILKKGFIYEYIKRYFVQYTYCVLSTSMTVYKGLVCQGIYEYIYIVCIAHYKYNGQGCEEIWVFSIYTTTYIEVISRTCGYRSI